MYRITFIACLLGALLLAGCGDKCDDVNCGPNGTCVEGTCNCDPGYSGAMCETNVCDDSDCGPNGTCDPVTGACDCEDGYVGDNCDKTVVDDLLGIWGSLDFGCAGEIDGLEMEIVQGEGPFDLIMREPGDVDNLAAILGVWTNETSFENPRQELDGDFLSGTGTLENGILTWNLLISSGSDEVGCFGTFTKQ